MVIITYFIHKNCHSKLKSAFYKRYFLRASAIFFYPEDIQIIPDIISKHLEIIKQIKHYF